MKKKLLSAALIALVSISLASCDESLEDLFDLETGDEESSEVEPSTPEDPEIPETPETPETPEHTHSYDEGVVTKEATCTEEGSKVYTCECGETYTETIEALGHDYVLTTTVEPTCGEDGSKVYDCSRCEATYTETLDATGEHTWGEGQVTKEATCTEAGETTYTCSVCSDTKTEPIEALGHDFEGGTYKSDGTHHWKVCSRCEVEDTENKAEHQWNEGETTTTPSCTEAGETTYTCTICEATKTSEISATGHSWSEWAEVAGGETHTRTCSICEETETEDHTWDNGEITTAATCDTDGVKTYTCTVCNATKTESIDMLGHTLGGEYYGKGEIWYQYCSVCESYVAVEAPTEAGSFTVTDETSLVTAISLGGYITFGSDICISKTLALYDDATLDLAGHKLYNVDDCYLGNDIISNGCSLLSIRGDISVTITGNGTFDSKENDCFAFDMSKGGAASTAAKGPSVTIESGTYIGNIDSVYVAQGELNVLDGYFSIKQTYTRSSLDGDNGRSYTINLEDASHNSGDASAILYGGSYEGFDPSASYSEATVADNYCVKENGATAEGVTIYTVTQKAYKLGSIDTSNYVYRWFKGSTTGSTFLATSTSYEEGVDVYITAISDDGIDNSCTLSFYSSGNLKYISNNNSTSVTISNDPCTWVWVENSGNGFFAQGTSSGRALVQYTDGSFRGYAQTTDNLKNPHVIPFETEPEEMEIPETPEDITLEQVYSLTSGETYYMGGTSSGQQYLITGSISNYNLATSVDFNSAAAITITGNDTNGWTLTIESGTNAGKYIYAYASGSYIDFGVSSNTTVPNSGTNVFLWNSSKGVFYTDKVLKSNYSYSYFEFYSNVVQLYGTSNVGNASNCAAVYQAVSK